MDNGGPAREVNDRIEACTSAIAKLMGAGGPSSVRARFLLWSFEVNLRPGV